MPMKPPIFSLSLALVMTFTFAATSAETNQTNAELARLEREAFSKLNYQKGEINLKNGVAKLKLTDNFRYLPPKDAKTVLVDLWGNPPGLDTIGMIVPADLPLYATNAWAVIISYEEDGYVKDADANTIDYDKLLKTMRANIKKRNKEREKEGYPSLELLGWATPPHYDQTSHKLHWAKELKFSDSDENTVNYDIRVLGRKGVLSMNTVASMSSFESISKVSPEIVAMAEFNPGYRYSDFNGSSDKVATYGLAALVAGGIAAKAGFFKVLLVGILAAKKFIIIAVIGLGVYLKKLFAKNQNT